MKRIILLTLIISTIFMVGCSIPETDEEKIKWCMKNKPFFNSSSIEGLQTPYKVELGKIQRECYTTYWSEYCKIRSPNDCPN